MRTSVYGNIEKIRLRKSYLKEMDVQFPFHSEGLISTLITKCTPYNFGYDSFKEDFEFAMRSEETLQKLREGHGKQMSAQEFLKELGKW
jgi:hypothetical protein